MGALIRSACLVAMIATAALLMTTREGSAAPGPTPASEHDLVCRPPSRARATVLLFHGGGFIAGGALDLARECQGFARHGYLAVSIAYSHHLRRALREAKSRANALGARAHAAQRPVFAYGLSAGGAFAATLAARGEVDAAFAYAGIYDIARWTGGSSAYLKAMRVTRAQIKRVSPVNLRLRRPAPLLIAHNPYDIVAPYRDAVRMARRSPRFRLVTMRRPANGYAAHVEHPMVPALAFFARHLKHG